MIGEIDASGRNASFVQEDWLAPSYDNDGEHYAEDDTAVAARFHRTE
jgi:hypothetical protein